MLGPLIYAIVSHHHVISEMSNRSRTARDERDKVGLPFWHWGIVSLKAPLFGFFEERSQKIAYPGNAIAETLPIKQLLFSFFSKVQDEHALQFIICRSLIPSRSLRKAAAVGNFFQLQRHLLL